MRKIRAYGRVVIFISSMALYMVVFYLVLPFKKNALEWGLKLRLHWMKLTHRVLGLKIAVKGEVPSEGTLLVSNHQSAIDPIVIMKFIKVFPVGKYEIRKYPIIGFAAEKTGVLFVKRDQKDHRTAIRNQICELLESGRSVLLFPEGTVNEGREVLPLKVGGFSAALKARKPIVPVCIQYHSGDAIWKPGQGLKSHFFEQIENPVLRIDLHFGSPLKVDTPENLAEQARQFMADKQFFTEV